MTKRKRTLFSGVLDEAASSLPNRMLTLSADNSVMSKKKSLGAYCNVRLKKFLLQIILNLRMEFVSILMDLLVDDDEINIALPALCENSALSLELFNNERHKRSQKFFEQTIPRYNVDDFQMHFRMNIQSFEVRIILNLI